MTGVYCGDDRGPVRRRCNRFVGRRLGARPTDFVGPETYLTAMLIEAGCEGSTVAQCHLPGQNPAGTLRPVGLRGQVRLRHRAALRRPAGPWSPGGRDARPVGARRRRRLRLRLLRRRHQRVPPTPPPSSTATPWPASSTASRWGPEPAVGRWRPARRGWPTLEPALCAPTSPAPTRTTSTRRWPTGRRPTTGRTSPAGQVTSGRRPRRLLPLRPVHPHPPRRLSPFHVVFFER